MPDIFHCWNCAKRLEDYNEETPFHCSDECKSQCKVWNFKPEIVNEDDKYQSVVKAIEPPQEQEIEFVPMGEFACTHKYNCRAHRLVCMAKYGYGKL